MSESYLFSSQKIQARRALLINWRPEETVVRSTSKGILFYYFSERGRHMAAALIQRKRCCSSSVSLRYHGDENIITQVYPSRRECCSHGGSVPFETYLRSFLNSMIKLRCMIPWRWKYNHSGLSVQAFPLTNEAHRKKGWPDHDWYVQTMRCVCKNSHTSLRQVWSWTKSSQ
jgi:hypothetical protein